MPPVGAAHDRYRSPIPGPPRLTRGGVPDRRQDHPGSSGSHRSTVPPRREYPHACVLLQRLTTLTPHRSTASYPGPSLRSNIGAHLSHASLPAASLLPRCTPRAPAVYSSSVLQSCTL